MTSPSTNSCRPRRRCSRAGRLGRGLGRGSPGRKRRRSQDPERSRRAASNPGLFPEPWSGFFPAALSQVIQNSYTGSEDYFFGSSVSESREFESRKKRKKQSVQESVVVAVSRFFLEPGLEPATFCAETHIDLHHYFCFETWRCGQN